MHEAHMVACHDMISNLLLEIGWLPLSLLFFVAILTLHSFHRSVWNLRGTRMFNVCLWLVGVEFGLLVHDIFAGNITSTFPVNFFFWFIAGALNSCFAHHEECLAESHHAPAAAPAPQEFRVVHPLQSHG